VILAYPSQIGSAEVGVIAATYAAPVSGWADEQRQRGGNAEFLEFVDGVLSKSIASGYGDEELSAVIKLWWNRH
jgi:hypothetical protein